MNRSDLGLFINFDVCHRNGCPRISCEKACGNACSKKIKLAELTLDLLIIFSSNRYSVGV